MQRNSRAAICAACLAFMAAGCASSPPRTVQPAQADYVAMSCEELAKEGKCLMRTRARKQELLLDSGKDAASERQIAKERLKAVLRAAGDKGC